MVQMSPILCAYLHNPDGVSTMDLTILAELLPERGHTPLQVFPLPGIFRVHICLCSMVSTSSLNKRGRRGHIMIDVSWNESKIGIGSENPSIKNLCTFQWSNIMGGFVLKPVTQTSFTLLGACWPHKVFLLDQNLVGVSYTGF